MNTPLTLSFTVERWPIAGAFTISRGAKTEAVVVVAELSDSRHRGRGECVPYVRYGERVDSVCAQIETMRAELAAGFSRQDLQKTMPAGAARNALDCAFWDLEAKRTGKPVHELAGLPAPRPLTTAYTISLGRPDEMARAAAKAAGRALLKVKLGGSDDDDSLRIAAVRAAAPATTLIVDANEGWNGRSLAANIAACVRAGVKLIEQPLPEGEDALLANIARPIPVCADESAHDRASLGGLAGKYDAVNVKLDKAGGLTEALAMSAEAAALGFTLLAGSMVATSLAVAPAMLFAQAARFVDLDGPLLLAKDREQGLVYQDSLVFPATSALWG